MGLLTDTSVEGGWLGAMVLAHHKLLAATMYLVGTAWFLALAHNSMNHETYFSENALLPGLVQGEFIAQAKVNRYLQELTKEAERYQSSMPHSWLQAKMTQLGLDTYTHNFTLHYPMAVNKSYTGTNVYGILRAVRGSSTESIVLSTPYRPPLSVHNDNAPAIALMLALADFFAGQVYWAKDIIFLVSEHEQLGVAAWLAAYHGVPAGEEGVLDHGVLPARAGLIQAAVNLEISSSLVSHVDVRYEGLNGQLPNLDLVNLLHRLCHRESVRHTTKNRHDPLRPLSLQGWLHQLGTLAATVATQASGVPSGNHGLFHRYGVAAVTVSGEQYRHTSADTASRSASLLNIGRVLEGTCRSLNNLLERFHQSFFFYLMPATNRYISIGVYMPAFGVMGSSLVLIALALWCSSSQQQQQLQRQQQHLQEQEEGEAPENEKAGSSHSLISCCGVLVAVHCIGLVVGACPRPLALLGASFTGLSPEDAISIGLTAVSLSLLTLPTAMRRFKDSDLCHWSVVKCVAVLELSVLLFAGAVHNFSLALIITLLYTPVVMVVSPLGGRLLRWSKCLLLLLIHPLSLLVIFVVIDTVLQFPDESLVELAVRCTAATKRSLMYGVVDAMVYGNWVLPVACTCLMPVWMLLWHVQHSEASDEVVKCVEEEEEEAEEDDDGKVKTN